MMAVSTFGVGCLPSYSRIGFTAPLLLVLLRCLQGVSVGGQLVGTFLFTVEAAPEHERGYYGSFSLASAVGGTLTGSAVSWMLHQAFSEEALMEWAWRIPFLMGVWVGPLMYMVEGAIIEEHTNDHAPVKNGRTPRATELHNAEAGALMLGSSSPRVPLSPRSPSTVANTTRDSCRNSPAVQAVLHHPLAVVAAAAATTLLSSTNYICLVPPPPSLSPFLALQSAALPLWAAVAHLLWPAG
mmetsp:Transcript_31657/g.89945  ORF Transcript_31657/g.89945 Transcript_31657/m.89945 type:complete len:241 (-) Transcript_31657:764-1486(-)